MSHVALLKAEKDGRVGKRSADGMFDVETCRRELEQNSQPIKSRSARVQQQQAEPEVLAESLGEDLPLLAGSGELPAEGSVAEATRQLEWERVREKRLKVDREQGKLADVTEVNAFVAGMIIQAREELIRLPAEMRDALAHETDPLKCEAVLHLRLSAVLGKMSEYHRESQ